MGPGIPHQVPDSQHVSLAGVGTCVVTSGESKLYGTHCDGHIPCPPIKHDGRDIVVCTSKSKLASPPASILGLYLAPSSETNYSRSPTQFGYCGSLIMDVDRPKDLAAGGTVQPFDKAGVHGGSWVIASSHLPSVYPRFLDRVREEIRLACLHGHPRSRVTSAESIFSRE